MINFNGALRPDEEARLLPSNRSFRYADGVFATIKYAKAHLQLWEDHYFRLMGDMRILRMSIPLPWSPEYLEEEIRKTLESNALDQGAARVRLTVFRNGGGNYVPETNEVSYLIEVYPMVDEEFILPQAGKKMELFQEHRKPTGLLSNLKSNSAQVYVLAGIFARENGFDDCFLLNETQAFG